MTIDIINECGDDVLMSTPPPKKIFRSSFFGSEKISMSQKSKDQGKENVVLLLQIQMMTVTEEYFAVAIFLALRFNVISPLAMFNISNQGF